MTTRRPPAPHVQAFVVCREIDHAPRTGEIVIIGPVSHIPAERFPADIVVAVYAHATDGHGVYHRAFELRDADGDDEIARQPLLVGPVENAGERTLAGCGRRLPHSYPIKKAGTPRNGSFLRAFRT